MNNENDFTTAQNKKRKPKNYLKYISVILILMLIITPLCACKKSENNRFAMYCGLNDAQTGDMLISIEDAQATIRTLILDSGLGYTEFVSYGGFTSEGKKIGNTTLVYVICDADANSVKTLAKKIKDELNLSAVMLEETSSSTYFVQ